MPRQLGLVDVIHKVARVDGSEHVAVGKFQTFYVLPRMLGVVWTLSGVNDILRRYGVGQYSVVGLINIVSTPPSAGFKYAGSQPSALSRYPTAALATIFSSL